MPRCQIPKHCSKLQSCASCTSCASLTCVRQELYARWRLIHDPTRRFSRPFFRLRSDTNECLPKLMPLLVSVVAPSDDVRSQALADVNAKALPSPPQCPQPASGF